MTQQRIRAKARRYFRILLIVLPSALVGAASALVVMLATSAGTIPFEDWAILMHIAGQCAAFGAILGTIAALDRSDGAGFVPQWLGRPINTPCCEPGSALLLTRWPPPRFGLGMRIPESGLGFLLVLLLAPSWAGSGGSGRSTSISRSRGQGDVLG